MRGLTREGCHGAGTRKWAARQDIRPLRIGLAHLMPKKIADRRTSFATADRGHTAANRISA